MFCCDVAEVAHRAGVFALSGTLEAEVGRRAGSDASEGRIVLEVVSRKSRAVSDALANMKVKSRLASSAIARVDARQALGRAFRASHASQVLIEAI